MKNDERIIGETDVHLKNIVPNQTNNKVTCSHISHVVCFVENYQIFHRAFEFWNIIID